MPPSSHNFRPLTERESDQFDSLRGISALAVVVGHVNQILMAPAYDKLSPWMGLLSQSAVMMFFVMSGFLIEKSISSNMTKHHGKFSLPKYLADRTIRIWPPLILSLALLAFLCYLAPAVFPSGSNAFLPAAGHPIARQALTYDPTQAIGAALALNGFFTDTPDANGPLWSLSIEVWYYALAAIIAWPRRWWKLASIPAVIALFFVGWNNDQFFYYLPVWWIGYLLSEAHNRRSVPSPKYLWAGAGALFLAAVVLAIKSLTVEDARSAWHFLVLFNIVTGCCFAAILGLILTGKVRLPIAFRPAAAYSYTLYIIHVPILLFLFGLLQAKIQDSIGRSAAAACGAIVAIVITSFFAAKVVENRPLIRSLFARRLIRRAN